MDKKIGLFWLRDDFRVIRNNGLIEATRNHDSVVVFYLYKKDAYNAQEAQKWWLSKSLLNFKKKLNDLNINLEIVETISFKIFFEKLIKNKDFKIYWNKVYEPEYLKFDEYLFKSLKNKNIDDIKKMMALHSRYSHLFGELLKNTILRKSHHKKKL